MTSFDGEFNRVKADIRRLRERVTALEAPKTIYAMDNTEVHEWAEGLLSLEADATPEPIAEVGDMIMVNGNWLRVKQYDADHNRGRPAYLAGPDDHDAADWWGQHAIEDIYTKAEQEANGALVFVHWYLPNAAKYDVAETFWDGGSGWLKLTPEASAALGEFQPVPDRAIVVGDVVRLREDRSKVGLVEIARSFIQGRYTDGRAMIRRPFMLELVAPEDPAYREAKEQSQQQILSDIATGAAFECSGDRDCLAKDHEDDCQYDPGFDGSCDPHPDDSWVSGSPDPAPEIPESWDLITAGDGRHFAHGAGSDWYSLDGRATWLTNDEIAALGPVRRAVVVTLPDGWTIDQVRMLVTYNPYREEGEK